MLLNAILLIISKKILGPALDEVVSDLSHVNPFGRIDDNEALELIIPVTTKEIEEAIKIAIPNKAPGPDGFNAHFYKICWPNIGKDVCLGIKDFFSSSKMLHQLKATFIVLVPKIENASTLDKYSPIALTNELYKTITRILVNRMKAYLSKIVRPSQSAFIPVDLIQIILLYHRICFIVFI